MEKTAKIWSDFSDRLLRFISSKIPNTEDAHDIRQEVFVKIHTQLDKLKNDEKLEAWVYQISRHAIADYYRRHYKTTQDTHPALETMADTAEQNLAYQQHAYCCLEPFIRELPEKYQQVILLTHQGHKQAEIAHQLNTSLSNVKMRFQRAKDMLKKDFISCCGYHLDAHGKLTGEQDCQRECRH
ncbi:sigma-70 family RNA polymerase sigma factor [uncultured Microscilla sp.]|uniref:sigma-70 family RNA polymerase sigma factor n=1 Tax=uncultured Microscilla sp. TaxID=432653 RepID=UPI0026215D7E|nr:sigma-70 family RNA polymerase sigma factor [uncultured Microscilla sp.]